jgi:UDP-N-acetylmuramate--alanine ligase
MVAEADESDRSFLMLLPSIAVMTNIDHEHMDTYGSFEELQRAFVDFANKVPFYGSVVACADDPHVRAACESVTRRVVTYGLELPAAGAESPAIAGRDVALGTFGGRCTVFRRGTAGEERLGTLELTVPGRHNLQNALAAVAVAGELDIDFAAVAATLRDFHGAERRFERVGEANGVLVVDDYGHHPTEIAAVLAAAKVTLGRRLLVAFQPHRYTRTERLLHDFGPAFADADEVVLTDIYAAGEEPIPGVTVEALAETIGRATGRPARVVKSIERLADELAAAARPGDAVLTLGAGSIAAVPKRLLAALTEREARA